MFSVVIPTLWIPKTFLTQLELISQSSLVDEIIIVSNNRSALPNKTMPSKVKLIDLENNIGVNPAWNLGIANAENDKVIVANDDILFDTDIFSWFAKTVSEEFGCIGVDPISKVDPSIEEVKKRNHGFGFLFCINKKTYTPIPEDIKIFFGDDWIFTSCRKKGFKNYCIKGFSFSGEESASSKQFRGGVLNEFQQYSRHIKGVYKNDYKFSVIVPHYDGAISDKDLLRGLGSLERQTFRDFEVILLHDGPLSRKLPNLEKLNLNIKTIITEKRYNDWGHSLRDIGIKEAKGEYLLFFNADNILYPQALEEIDRVSKDNTYRKANMNGYSWNSDDIIIYPIYLMGQTYNGHGVTRHKGKEDEIKCILTGYPAQTNFIDCMQLVMRKSKWDYYGGWYDKSFASDGAMYARFVHENLGARYCDEILGEHL